MSTIISGPLDEHGYAVVEVSMFNTVFKAGIDTGSVYNLFTPGMAHRFNLLKPSEEIHVINPLTGIAKAKKFPVEYFISGIQFTTEFIEMPSAVVNYPYRLILGNRFLLSCEEFQITGRNKRFRLCL